ncbi:unnamed protein product [Schistocephalus solidus]|uniref:RING-type domain-containing protein n=1 Tax=Schistocephalus solidus TaxID=70667 RepID=A0A183TBK3_SCHSO|nr:unnamed protein product [Schistocephalus solidus]
MTALQVRKEEFEELATCVFCLSLCKTPLVLHCQHYFCEKPCLEQYIGKRKLVCPICSCPFTEDQPQPFRFLNQLLEKLKPVEDSFECPGCSRNFYQLQYCPITQRRVCRECAQRARREFEADALSSAEPTKVCSKWPLCGDVDCPDVHPTGFCQNIGCRGTEYCRKMHMDELKRYLAAGPSRQIQASQQQKEAAASTSCSAGRQSRPSSKTSAPAPTSSAVKETCRPARPICAEITCPGAPTCEKIHLSDLPKFLSGTAF